MNNVKRTPYSSGRHRWLMRLMAVTLVPLFMLGLLEFGLRVAGYGYSTRFFIPSEIGGKQFLVPNREFTHRFFPPALARTPLPMRMAAQKPEGTYRIFLFGESAAYGDPEPSFGMGRYLEALLEARYPSTDFEVVCVAITAINSHVILPIARDCAQHDGDLWVIYMGNNEMVGPFGAGTVFGQRAPSLGFVRSGLWLKSTRLGQLLDNLATGLQSDSSAPESWTGIDMFTRNQLRYNDADRLRAYENFKGNLEDILSTGRKAGVPIILSTVASNLRDCAPFASLHSGSLEESKRLEWDRLYQEGTTLEAAGSFEAALDRYARAAALDPDFAELQFRMGTCHLALHNSDQALKAFERARDYDALAVRADTRINQIIKDTILHDGQGTVVGVDAVEVFARESADGIPGQELFYEHVHLTMEGNFRMAQLLADAVAEQLPAAIANNGVERNAAFDVDACARRLAVTLWEQKRIWDVALGRISVAPFTAQSSHSRNTEYCKLRMQEVDSRMTPKTPASDRQMYLAALQRDPDDTFVRWNFAQFLRMIGAASKAIKQGEMICERLPHAPYPHYFVGTMMAKEGRTAEATEYLQQALEIDSHFAAAREALEQIQIKDPSTTNSRN